MNFEVKEIRPGVIHTEFDNLYNLTSTYMRLQEFYESPFRDIKGKFFKHEKYMDKYARSKGSFSYYEDWTGFNVPGDVVIKFIKLFKYDMWHKEQVFFKELEKHIKKYKDKFYIIGTAKNRKRKKSNNTLNHELAHAYFYLCPKYKNKISSLIKKINSKHYNKMEESLIEMGYDKKFILDEVQAYCTTSSALSISMMLDINSFRIPKDTKLFFKEFDETQKRLIKG